MNLLFYKNMNRKEIEIESNKLCIIVENKYKYVFKETISMPIHQIFNEYFIIIDPSDLRDTYTNDVAYRGYLAYLLIFKCNIYGFWELFYVDSFVNRKYAGDCCCGPQARSYLNDIIRESKRNEYENENNINNIQIVLTLYTNIVDAIDYKKILKENNIEKEIYQDEGVEIITKNLNNIKVVYKKYIKRLYNENKYEKSIYKLTRGNINIITLLDLIDDNIFVFPYIEDDYKPIEKEEIKIYMIQLLQALSFCHEKIGIIHRNIKRKNILFSRYNKHLYLIDFEHAIHINDNDNYIVGNGYYCSPQIYIEKFSLFSKYKNKKEDDIYAVGVVFSELLLNVEHIFTFENDRINLEQRIKKYEKKEVEQIFEMSNLTTKENDLLCSMLYWDPDERSNITELLNNNYFKYCIYSEDKNIKKENLLNGIIRKHVINNHTKYFKDFTIRL